MHTSALLCTKAAPTGPQRQVQQLFNEYTDAAGIKERSIHQNTRLDAQITHPLHEQVFRELEPHPKMVQIS